MRKNVLAALRGSPVLRRPAVAGHGQGSAPMASGHRPNAGSVLKQVLFLQLCPKASAENIPEYVALRQCLQRGILLGWPRMVCLQTWIVLQGIRGKEGVEAAGEVMGIGVPSWSVDAYCEAFCKAWLLKYKAAKQSSGHAAALGHEEGLAQAMSGHWFVKTLRRQTQRVCILNLAEKMNAYRADVFGAEQVLEVKEEINQSGILLRLPTRKKQGAGLAKKTGYNAMNWARCFSLIMCDLYAAPPLRFSPVMWQTMLDCQGGNEVAEALLFFGVSSADDANELLDTCPALSWPTLFVALCESRQAWQHFRDEGAEFCRIVEYVQSREKKCSAFIRRVTHHIRERGAQGTNCFSVRLFLALSKRFPSR